MGFGIRFFGADVENEMAGFVFDTLEQVGGANIASRIDGDFLFSLGAGRGLG